MQSLCTWKMSLLDMSLTISRHDYHNYCYKAFANKAFTEVTGQKINRGAGYGLEVPCIYRLYGPKVYIQRMNELVSSLRSLTLDGQKVVHILLLPNFFMREHFVGGFLLAAYGDQKCIVAKGAGRRVSVVRNSEGPLLGGS